MPSFLCVKSIEVPINRYKCLLKCCDVVEGLLAGDVWEVIFVMAVPTLTSPTVMIPSWRNLCTTQYFPVNYIYLCIWVCVCGQVRSSIPVRVFLSYPEHFSSHSLLSRSSTTTIGPRAFPLIWCLQSSVCTGVWALQINSKDCSSLSLLHFQAQITWDVFRPAWLLAGFFPEVGNGNQENKYFIYFFSLYVSEYERKTTEKNSSFWAIWHLLVMCNQGSSSPLIQTGLF